MSVNTILRSTSGAVLGHQYGPNPTIQPLKHLGHIEVLKCFLVLLPERIDGRRVRPIIMPRDKYVRDGRWEGSKGLKQLFVFKMPYVLPVRYSPLCEDILISLRKLYNLLIFFEIQYKVNV